MSEITKADLFELMYLFLGQISIFVMIITGDLFMLFFVGLFALMYFIHSWIAFKTMERNFFFNRKRREIQDKYDMLKLEAVVKELKEIQKLLKKKR